MPAARSIASIVRHTTGALAEAALIAALIAMLALALSPMFGPARSFVGLDNAFAAKGGNNVTATSTLSLDQAGQALKLGDPVTFHSSAVGLSGAEYPMVLIACYAVSDGSKLYAQLDHPDATFVLGNGSSRWWLVPVDASCTAELYAYGGKSKGFDTIRLLASAAPFLAAGG